jgi:hypothetical protein
MRKGDFASFRSSTGKAALAGFQEAKTKVDAGTATQKDTEVYQNYQALADHLNTSLFGIGANSEQARLAAAQAAQAAAGEGETADATGYGLGASARAEAAWRDFVTAARSGPAAGSGGSSGSQPGGGGQSGGNPPTGQGGGSGGGIIIPPSGYTGSQG